MRISQLLQDNAFELVSDNLNDKEITGLYCGDLLSWVMNHASRGNLWCTVLTHPNVIAIASLLELSCVIICENAPLDDDTIKKANSEGINLLKTYLNSVEVIKKLLSYD
ncbi:MAG TPA: AraC family transcriptional regulator [Haloplasmataceae bacterium]